MHYRYKFVQLFLLGVFLQLTAGSFHMGCVTIAQLAETPPTESESVPSIPEDWIDPATGHRVVRLSVKPGSRSLYFHQHAFTPDGAQMLIVTKYGLEIVDLKNRRLKKIVPRDQFSMGGSSGVEMGRNSRRVFYQSFDRTQVLATNIDSGQTQVVASLPRHGSFNSVNADETKIFGAIRASTPQRSEERRMKLFTVDLKTQQLTAFQESGNWLNHLQASPTDPEQGLFCHEGPWHEVDRVWTIRFGALDAKLIHRRQQPFEIAGHEFFSKDGNWVWYDLQTPRSETFWLAGYHIKTGQRRGYSLKREEWSVHYNISPDGNRFAGDGGGPSSVANRSPMPQKQRLNPPGNGTWIYLFRPTADTSPGNLSGEPADLGELVSEKLVDLASHDYRLEPNVVFSSDGKWIVFRSNVHGPIHVYAVEVEATRKPESQTANTRKTKLLLIGDSTVKNGSGTNEKKLFGWGEFLHEHFDSRKIEVENRALGGRSSRSYLTEGLWEKSRSQIGTGDYVMIQFGHNDAGEMFRGDRPRASIKGNTEDSQTGIVESTGKSESVQSYGWYLRNYIADVKSRGAIPIILSPVPRNRWSEGRVLRSDEDYGRWAREAAEQGGAYFIDLNQRVAESYELRGSDQVAQDFFTAEDWTHTTSSGAKHTAKIVAQAIRELKRCHLRKRLISSTEN